MGRYGVRCVVEPGGSMRNSPKVAEACSFRGITLMHSGHRLVHHERAATRWTALESIGIVCVMQAWDV